MERLILAARCALADLAGILPQFAPDVDTHPGWRTMVHVVPASALRQIDASGKSV